VDALDVDARTVLDRVDDVDDLRLEVPITARSDRRERISALGDFDRHVFDSLLDRLGIVDVAGDRPHLAPERVGVNYRNARLQVDDAEPVAVAFLDREGDDEAAAARVVFAHRRYYAHIGEAVLEVEPAQQVPVNLDPVGVVDVVRFQKAQQAGFTGLDDVLESAVRIVAVSDEDDLLHAGLGALVDLEDQVHPV